MIRTFLTNEMMNRLLAIERQKVNFGHVHLSVSISSRLRKSSRKKSSYASNRIEGNPLSEAQAAAAIDSRSRRHYLKPEQEVRNYYAAMEYLGRELKNRTPFSARLLLEVQKLVVSGESPEKIGFRGAMPPGVLFAVYGDKTGAVDYIPPAFDEVEGLVEELAGYLNTSDDHPVIKAAVAHYQLVTIHPFEDGNGRTARLMSDYVLDLNGYGFNGIGSLEEYFAYDIDEYYRSLQMGLPPLYYDGRNNPPHPEIWLDYFLRMMELHAAKALELAQTPAKQRETAALTHLSAPERRLLDYLRRNGIEVFTPVELAKKLKVTNRTVINWCAALAENGFIAPNITGKRIRSYRVN